MSQNKSSMAVQLPGCLTLFSPIIPCRHLGLFKVKVKEKNPQSPVLEVPVPNCWFFFNSFCFCSRNYSQIEIHTAFQCPRSYYEYIGSVLVPSFAIFGGSSNASRHLITWWVTQKDKARLCRYTPQEDEGQRSQTQQGKFWLEVTKKFSSWGWVVKHRNTLPREVVVVASWSFNTQWDKALHNLT